MSLIWRYDVLFLEDFYVFSLILVFRNFKTCFFFPLWICCFFEICSSWIWGLIVLSFRKSSSNILPLYFETAITLVLDFSSISPASLTVFFTVFSFCLHAKTLPIYFVHVCAVCWSCPTLCDPMECSPPCSPVHGVFQPRILGWVAMPFSRGFS